MKQQNGHAELLQLPRELHHRGGAEAVAEEDNAGGRALLRVECAIAIAVERAVDELERQVAPGVFDGFDVDSGQIHGAKLQRQYAHGPPRRVPDLARTHEAEDEIIAGRQRRGRSE